MFAIIICGYPFLYLAIISPVTFNVVFLNIYTVSTRFIPQTSHKKRTTQKEKNDWKLFMLDFKQPHISLSSLKQIKCPALIIGGDHDLIPVKHTVLIAENIPKGLLWIVPNSGHATLQEHKQEFNNKVDAFFQSN